VPIHERRRNGFGRRGGVDDIVAIDLPDGTRLMG